MRWKSLLEKFWYCFHQQFMFSKYNEVLSHLGENIYLIPHISTASLDKSSSINTEIPHMRQKPNVVSRDKLIIVHYMCPSEGKNFHTHNKLQRIFNFFIFMKIPKQKNRSRCFFTSELLFHPGFLIINEKIKRDFTCERCLNFCF